MVRPVVQVNVYIGCLSSARTELKGAVTEEIHTAPRCLCAFKDVQLCSMKLHLQHLPLAPHLGHAWGMFARNSWRVFIFTFNSRQNSWVLKCSSMWKLPSSISNKRVNSCKQESDTRTSQKSELHPRIELLKLDANFFRVGAMAGWSCHSRNDDRNVALPTFESPYLTHLPDCVRSLLLTQYKIRSLPTRTTAGFQSSLSS